MNFAVQLFLCTGVTYTKVDLTDLIVHFTLAARYNWFFDRPSVYG